MNPAFRVVPAGDSAVTVEFEERVDPAINQQAIALASALEALEVPGLLDVVPGFRTVTVFFSAVETDRDALSGAIARAAEARPTLASGRPPTRIPVCYGGDLGPDLPRVAEFGRVSEADAVSLHTGRSYRVFMLGFVPGFAYMGLVDERIAAPRQATARIRVSRGSVGIAGRQTGIYPADTPGGWQIVGRTPLRPFDSRRPAPFLFAPGDAVEFYAIDRPAFDRLEAAEREARQP
jgi:KipI family sensor histidine kinase inhibitor